MPVLAKLSLSSKIIVWKKFCKLLWELPDLKQRSKRHGNYPMSRKKLCLSYAICSYSTEIGWFPCLLDRCFKSGNTEKNLHNFFQTMILPDKDNFARSGMKTWIKLYQDNLFLVFKFFSSLYSNLFVFIKLCIATMIVLKTYDFSEFLTKIVIINYFDKKFKISKN